MATRKPPKKPTTKPKARKGAKAKPGEPKAPAKQEAIAEIAKRQSVKPASRSARQGQPHQLLNLCKPG